MAIRVGFRKVGHEAFPARDFLEKTTAARHIFLVGSEMIGEIRNFLGEDCDLHFWRSRVTLFGGKFLDNRGFSVLAQHGS